MNYFDAKWYGNGQGRAETRPCRGMYMKAEEIDRERKMSGWNQYPGEEEADIPSMGGRNESRDMRENMEHRVENDDRTASSMMSGGQSMGSTQRMPNGQSMENSQWMSGGQSMEDSQRMSGGQSMGSTQRMPSGQPMEDTQWMSGGQSMEDSQWMSGSQPMGNMRRMPGGQPASDMRSGNGMGMDAGRNQYGAGASMGRPGDGRDRRKSCGQPCASPTPRRSDGTAWNAPSMMYETYDAADLLRDQQVAEQDMRRLQSMFPESARMLLPYVEEECDKLEYEGSAMFDERPDRETVRRISENIYDQVRDQFPVQEERQAGEVLSMECRNCGRSGRNWPQDLIHVLLLQEMHQRRCRHGACRRRRW